MLSKQTKKPTRSPAVKQPAQGQARTISLSPAWERRLKDLEAFKKKHGHCNVPQRYTPNRPLGNWVARVRRLKQSGKIDSELARRLDGLGFTWVLRPRGVSHLDWDAMVTALTAFKKRHGHCCVTLQPAKYRVLGLWLIEVRRRKKMGLLDRRRIRELGRLGVVWEPRKQNWEDMFAELVAYRAKFGDCNVPKGWVESPRLALWVHHQRQSRKRSTLPQDHISRLDKIGFVWTRCEAWESKYAALVEYKRVHGHCRVPMLSEEYAVLGNWVHTLRTYRRLGKLSLEQIRRLTRLGFVWDGRQERGIRD